MIPGDPEGPAVVSEVGPDDGLRPRVPRSDGESTLEVLQIRAEARAELHLGWSDRVGWSGPVARQRGRREWESDEDGGDAGGAGPGHGPRGLPGETRDAAALSG